MIFGLEIKFNIFVILKLLSITITENRYENITKIAPIIPTLLIILARCLSLILRGLSGVFLSSSLAILPYLVLKPTLVTLIIALPFKTLVPRYISLFFLFSTSFDSPVNEDSSTYTFPSIITPSAGTISPDESITKSFFTTFSINIFFSCLSLITVQF